MINTIDLPSEFSMEISETYESRSVWGVILFEPKGSVNAGIQKNDCRWTRFLAAVG